MQKRLEQLDLEAQISALPPVVLGGLVVVPMGLLLPLCLWSRVAEPHWLAPPLLALPLFWARRSTEGARAWSPRFSRISVATALALSLAVHAWVLVPSMVRLLLMRGQTPPGRT